MRVRLHSFMPVLSQALRENEQPLGLFHWFDHPAAQHDLLRAIHCLCSR
jgi:hypothetical protein